MKGASGQKREVVSNATGRLFKPFDLGIHKGSPYEQILQMRSIPNAVELRRKTLSNAKHQTFQTRSVKLFQTLQTRSIKLFQTLQTRSIKLFQTLPTFKLFYVFLTPIKTTLKPDLIIEKWPENGLKDPLATYVHPCA